MLSKLKSFLYPIPPKILQKTLFCKKLALLETGTFTSSNGGNITTWQEVQAISAEYQRKCMVHFEDKGMFPKVHWMILKDSGRFLDRIPRG